MRSRYLNSLMMVLIGATSLHAQIVPMPASEAVPRTVVKLAPLSFFDPDNTIQFGVEQMVGQRQSVQAEFGYGWQGINLWQAGRRSQFSDQEIWRGRAEWRYYFTPTNQPIGRYVAVEGFYKQVNNREDGTVGRYCGSGPCQYYQLFSAPLLKYVWGAHVKIGRQFRLSPTDNRWLFDVYMGLGFRRRIVDRYWQTDETSYYFSEKSSLFDTYSTRPATLISVSCGFKIGYALF